MLPAAPLSLTLSLRTGLVYIGSLQVGQGAGELQPYGLGCQPHGQGENKTKTGLWQHWKYKLQCIFSCCICQEHWHILVCAEWSRNKSVKKPNRLQELTLSSIQRHRVSPAPCRGDRGEMLRLLNSPPTSKISAQWQAWWCSQRCFDLPRLWSSNGLRTQHETLLLILIWQWASVCHKLCTWDLLRIDKCESQHFWNCKCTYDIFPFEHWLGAECLNLLK